MPVVRGIRRFVEVPSSWEGWAMRVLTVALIIMIIAVVMLLQMVVGLRAFTAESRHQRLEFQDQETARQCQTLRNQGTPQLTLGELKC